MIESCKLTSNMFTGFTKKKNKRIKLTTGNSFNFLLKQLPINNRLIKIAARTIEAEKSAKEE